MNVQEAVEGQESAEQEPYNAELPEVFQYSFSQLTGAQRKARSESARVAQIDKLQQTVEAAGKALEAMVPNLKAPEEYEQVLQEEKQLKAVRRRCLLLICCL